MNMQYIQNILQSRHSLHSQADGSQYLPMHGDKGLISRVIGKFQSYLVELNRSYHREAEIQQAIEHLQAMNDQQLRDIGIARMDISTAVRFGNESI
jgi:uncharacterized protein YjiS (DUF1127 family)